MSATPPTAPFPAQLRDRLLVAMGGQQTGRLIIVLFRSPRCGMAEDSGDNANMLGIVQRDCGRSRIPEKVRRYG